MTSQAPEDTPRKEIRRLLVARAVGIAVALGLSALGIGGLGLVEAWFERRDAAVLATIPEVLVTWREPAETEVWALLLVLLAPMLLVPAAFAARGRPSPFPAWRWRVVSLAAALVAGGVGLQGLTGRPDLAVATPFGMSWLHDGKPREYWTWGAASAVAVGCAADGAVNYDVSFPSGREAALARDVKAEPGEVRRLVARLAPIDESLRARAVPRFAAADPACLSRLGQGLTAAEQAVLRTLFSR